MTRTKRRHKDSQRDRLSFHMNCAPLLREKLESLGFVQEKLSGKSEEIKKESEKKEKDKLLTKKG